jgi:hypothetical protein
MTMFVLKSFDGTPGGATSFDLYLASGAHAATSDVYTTFDKALEAVNGLVHDCQHTPQYVCDVALHPETFKCEGMFPKPGGSHWAYTRPCDTEAEAHHLIDEIVIELRGIGDEIHYTVAPYDGPPDIVDAGAG